MTRVLVFACALAGLCCAASSAIGQPRDVVRTRDGLEALVPDLADRGFGLPSGPLPFQHRLVFSPGFGQLGSEPLYTFRLAYNPGPWLGYEAAVDHNTGQSVHALLHTLSAIVRRPRSGRLQPYLSAGYGMILVFPGEAVNADPVTKNALLAGGGLEVFLRGDVSVRADLRHATVFGRERDRDGVVAYSYLHQSIGLSFYRSITP